MTRILLATGLLALTACKVRQGHFPKVAPDFALEIQHAGCRGTCQAYTLAVDARGNATYQGRHAVERVGDYSKTLAPKTVQALSKSILEAHFFDFDQEYGAGIDLPAVKTTVTMDGKTKSVNDIRNAPKELKELEARLEDLFGDSGWEKVESEK